MSIRLSFQCTAWHFSSVSKHGRGTHAFAACLGSWANVALASNPLEIIRGLLILYPRRVPICNIYIYIHLCVIYSIIFSVCIKQMNKHICIYITFHSLPRKNNNYNDNNKNNYYIYLYICICVCVRLKPVQFTSTHCHGLLDISPQHFFDELSTSTNLHVFSVSPWWISHLSTEVLVFSLL